jgi:colicin import membrane protein
MNRAFGVLMLAFALVLSQGNATAQKKESGKAVKKAETKDTKAEAKEKKTESKQKAPGSNAKKDAPSKSEDPAVGKTKDGKTVYEGARGGFYYLTEAGNKSYVQDFVGSKIVGKTADGLPIYEGPRGGRFYYSASGEKVYVKK